MNVCKPVRAARWTRSQRLALSPRWPGRGTSAWRCASSARSGDLPVPLRDPAARSRRRVASQFLSPVPGRLIGPFLGNSTTSPRAGATYPEPPRRQPRRGERHGMVLASLARGILRDNVPELATALAGQFSDPNPRVDQTTTPPHVRTGHPTGGHPGGTPRRSESTRPTGVGAASRWVTRRAAAGAVHLARPHRAVVQHCTGPTRRSGLSGGAPDRASGVQNLPDGGRRHGDPELHQLALDPAMAPRPTTDSPACHPPAAWDQLRGFRDEHGTTRSPVARPAAWRVACCRGCRRRWSVCGR